MDKMDDCRLQCVLGEGGVGVALFKAICSVRIPEIKAKKRDIFPELIKEFSYLTYGSLMVKGTISASLISGLHS